MADDAFAILLILSIPVNSVRVLFVFFVSLC
jgi:hypothetical protein